MIDKETLIEISKLQNLRPWQQEKHYMQSLILASISEYPLVFKGGTYLWFFHGLHRFSEDSDFTATEKLPDNIQKKVSESLSFFGVENKIKQISDNDTSLSFRIEAKGPLNTSTIDLCYVYIEISKREKIVEKTIPINFDQYTLPVKIINGMAIEEVAAEKIRAIITRNKARDVFDLAFLVNQKKARFKHDLVNEKLDYYGLKFSVELLNKKLKEKKKIWIQELKPLVFDRLPELDICSKKIIKWSTKT